MEYEVTVPPKNGGTATSDWLGAAVGADGDWGPLEDAVQNCAYNYHSREGKVLKLFYSSAQVGDKAGGERRY